MKDVVITYIYITVSPIKTGKIVSILIALVILDPRFSKSFFLCQGIYTVHIHVQCTVISTVDQFKQNLRLWWTNIFTYRQNGSNEFYIFYWNFAPLSLSK